MPWLKINKFKNLEILTEDVNEHKKWHQLYSEIWWNLFQHMET
jgi:hypothetical protein